MLLLLLVLLEGRAAGSAAVSGRQGRQCRQKGERYLASAEQLHPPWALGVVRMMSCRGCCDDKADAADGLGSPAISWFQLRCCCLVMLRVHHQGQGVDVANGSGHGHQWQEITWMREGAADNWLWIADNLK